MGRLAFFKNSRPEQTIHNLYPERGATGVPKPLVNQYNKLIRCVLGMTVNLSVVVHDLDG